MKLVSEELGIIESVQSIQWQVAAAFEAMTIKTSSTLEARVMERIFDRLTESMGHFEELIDKVKNARFLVRNPQEPPIKKVLTI